MKYCVVSFIFNNYEFVREIKNKSSFCDYFLITDNKDLKSDTWTVVYLKNFDTDELLGIQKLLMFKYSIYKYIPNIRSYDYIIRMDHSIQIEKNLDPIIDYIDKYKYDLMVQIHNLRNSFNDEYDTWIASRSLDIKFKNQFFEYCGIDNIGLIETTMMIYKNCKEIYNLLDNVYLSLKSNCNFEDRNDQCYFTYELYKLKDTLRILYGSVSLYRECPINPGYLYMCGHNNDFILEHDYIDYPTIMFGKEQLVESFNN